MPVYDENYIKAKVKEFNDLVNTHFWGDKLLKEGVHYTRIACISIDFVRKVEKTNYPQVYLEECRYKRKKKKMSRFIGTELEVDSGSDSE